MEKECLLCRSHKAIKIFEKDSIPYYRCQECCFLFSGQAGNPNLENEAIGNYEPAYVSYLEDSPEDEVNFTKLLRWIERFKTLKNARVLDIGTGTGKFVRFLRKRSIDADGLEPSPVLYKTYLSAESFFSFDNIEGLAAKTPNAKYDIVIINDVMEHVVAPHAFLKSLTKLLNHDGIVYINTPDAESLLARVCKKRWHFVNKYHFSLFSRKTLKTIAGQYGLREVAFGHFARFRSVGFVLQYYIDFIAGKNNGRIPKQWYKIVIPINFYDTMQCIYRYD